MDHKALGALISLTIFLSGCNPTTVVPSAIATPADNPMAGALVRATKIARASQDAESTAQAQATLDASATQAADRATQTEEAHMAATATAVAQATREAILAAQANWPIACVILLKIIVSTGWSG
jgi:hypothetical protein